MTDRDQRALATRWLGGRLDRRDLLKASAAGGAGLGLAAGPRAGPLSAQGGAADLQVSGDVEIEYWQYEFASKVALVNELIPQFQEANPQITINHVNFPYDDFQQQVAASVQAGEGPDVLNVFYGWVPVYAQQQLLIPLPAETFPIDQIEASFFPMIQAAKIDDAYYALPTAVRSLALFCNMDILDAAGKQPPTTWEEFLDVAVSTTVREGDELVKAGATYDPAGQGHHWWRECLNRQNGLVPMSEDKRTLNWPDPP